MYPLHPTGTNTVDTSGQPMYREHDVLTRSTAPIAHLGLLPLQSVL